MLAMSPQVPKPFVFVLMPFDKAFDDVYKLGIKTTAEEAGAYAERVDEQFFQGSILERIWNQISRADVVVADMTGRNANVFYEVGYAHALGKTTVLLTKSAEDIPFDLKHWPHIVYGSSISSLKEQLLPALTWAINSSRGNGRQDRWNLQVFLNGVPLELSADDADEKGIRLKGWEEHTLKVTVRNDGASQVTLKVHGAYLWVPRGQGEAYPKAVLSKGEHREFPSIAVKSPSSWLGAYCTQYDITSAFKNATYLPPSGFINCEFGYEPSDQERWSHRLLMRIAFADVHRDYFIRLLVDDD